MPSRDYSRTFCPSTSHHPNLVWKSLRYTHLIKPALFSIYSKHGCRSEEIIAAIRRGCHAIVFGVPKTPTRHSYALVVQLSDSNDTYQFESIKAQNLDPVFDLVCYARQNALTFFRIVRQSFELAFQDAVDGVLHILTAKTFVFFWSQSVRIGDFWYQWIWNFTLACLVRSWVHS